MKLCVAKTRFRIFEIKVVLALLADLANLCVKEPDRVCVNCVKDPDRVCVKDPDLDCKNKSPSKAIVSLGWLLSVRFNRSWHISTTPNTTKFFFVYFQTNTAI